MSNSMAILPNRLSYFYNFHGPSLEIDTACSSSLVALFEAVKAIRDGECREALVGGVNIICHPENSIAYYKAGMLSADGVCRPFDSKANGYVRSEGAVMLFIKPLKDAIADGNPIHAVIKGVACNHGGQAGGLTVPNPELQAELLLEAFKDAGIRPDQISYIETHGTGTPFGRSDRNSGYQRSFWAY